MGRYRSSHVQDASEARGPWDVVIYIEGIEQDLAAPVNSRPAVIRQINETFVPYILPIQTGTRVNFPNEDDFYHNVFSIMSGDRFDLGRYAEGKSAAQKFDRPGIVIVRCEIHSGMKAYILVLDTSTFTVPQADGAYLLPDIPPGSYSLNAWHPTLGEQVQPVVLKAGQEATINFNF